MKSKTIKLKSKKEPKKGNNIIRLNLEEIFDNTSPNDNCLTLIENNQKWCEFNYVIYIKIKILFLRF